jgi:hypothetical protein
VLPTSDAAQGRIRSARVARSENSTQRVAVGFDFMVDVLDPGMESVHQGDRVVNGIDTHQTNTTNAGR